MADRPGILCEHSMVPVACNLGQNGGKVLNNRIAVLTGATPTPFTCKRAASPNPRRRGRVVTLPSPRVQENFRHIAVLGNRVSQAVQLVAYLDVVCPPPAALEKCNILVELIVLVRITLSIRVQIRGSRGLIRLLQG